MGGPRQPVSDTREQILALCRRDFLSVVEIAGAIGKSQHTIRAHFVYKMAREGLLVTEKPLGTKYGQAYKTAK